MRRLALVLFAACHNDIVHTQQAFVAREPCGQGPYEVHIKADGKMGSEGVEVWACTAHRISGHVEMIAGGIPTRDVAFGEGADNARCLAGGPIVATASDGAAGGGGSGAIGGPGARGATPTLVEEPSQDNGALIPDDECKQYGLPGEYLMNDTMVSTEWLSPGADITVKIWSDAPNDLQGVVFLVRHAISTHTRAEEAKEDAEYEKEHAHDKVKPYTPPPTPDHGAPPAPLAEERPPQPAGAIWIAGYWTWTGKQWGWTSGFWRTDDEMPAPRMEVPGQAPSEAAIWVAGSWQLRAGAWIWIGGRWRR